MRPHKAIGRDGRLEDRPWPVLRHPCQKRRVLASRLVGTDARDHLNAGRAQLRVPLTRDLRIRVLDRRHDTRDSRSNDAFGARSRPTDVATRLECAIQRGATRCGPGRLQRMHLGVRTARHQVRPLSHHDAR